MNARVFDPDIPTLRRILAVTRTIAIVGLSQKSYRPSQVVAKYLIDHGYRVIPVNPAYTQILGETCYPSLRDVPEPIDVVDCFRRAEHMSPLAADAIAIGAKVLWLQLGVVNVEAAQQAAAAGLEVISDRCMKIEHARLLGDLECGARAL